MLLVTFSKKGVKNFKRLFNVTRIGLIDGLDYGELNTKKEKTENSKYWVVPHNIKNYFLFV